MYVCMYVQYATKTLITDGLMYLKHILTYFT